MEREVFRLKLEKLSKLISLIQENPKKLVKETLLSSYDDRDFLMKVLLYTYNPYYVYGLNKKSIDYDTYMPSVASFEDIFQLLDYLKANNTGKDIYKVTANNFISQFYENKELMKNILLKDLRCGIGIETINKVFKGLIPTFKVALCNPYDKESDLPKECAIVQPKLDGVRCIAIVSENGAVELYTRNGSKLSGYEEIENELSTTSLLGFVFDGEIIGSNFDNIMESLFAKQVGKQATYCIFDCMTLEEFETRNCSKEYSQRLELVEDAFLNYKNLKSITSTYLYESEITEANIKKLCELEVSCGYEGIVIKDSLARYEFKRSKSWIKYKNMLTDDYEVIDAQEGEGKYKGTLGALLVDVDGVVVKVGSGFSDEQRDTIWQNFSQFENTIAEVQYQEKTKDGSLRFPVFIKFRDDK